MFSDRGGIERNLPPLPAGVKLTTESTGGARTNANRHQAKARSVRVCSQ